jgi:hypothetical protein
MKTKLFLFVFALVLIAGIVYKFTRIEVNVNNKEVEKFLSSSTFNDFKKNSSIKIHNLDFKNMKTETFNEVNGNVYYVPVVKNKTQLGVLAIFSVDQGDKMNMLFSDYRNIAQGSIVVSTSSLVVAKFSATEVENGLYKIKLIEVPKTPVKIAKESNKLPFEIPIADAKAQGGSWWACVTDCYGEAKSACGGNTTCDFLCDLVNIVGNQCTISMAAACAIHCM